MEGAARGNSGVQLTVNLGLELGPLELNGVVGDLYARNDEEEKRRGEERDGGGGEDLTAVLFPRPTAPANILSQFFSLTESANLFPTPRNWPTEQ